MEMKGIRLLVADADSTVRDILRFCSTEEGWHLDEARDGVAAIKLLRRNRFHILILDRDLPIIDGMMVCEQACSNTPVIFLSRRSSEQDRLSCFEAGGSDFVQKPFYPRELIARAKSILRLSGVSADDSIVDFEKIRINISSQEVFVDNSRVRLTPREYGLLVFLCRNPNRAFSRESLLNLVWGQQFDGTDRTVDTHVKSIREKIQPYQYYISTVWGFGYKLESGD